MAGPKDDENVIPFSKTPKGETKPLTGGGNTTPDMCLKDAIGMLENVVILGTTKDGRKLFSSSSMTIEEIHFLVARSHHQLDLRLDGTQVFENK